MKNSKKIKFMSMFIVLFFVVLTLFAFGNNKEVEKRRVVMSWTITVFGDCDNQYVVDCSTTGSIECENFDEEIVYQRQGVNCPVALYKSDF